MKEAVGGWSLSHFYQAGSAGFPYPARFRLGEGDDYVKYAHAPFEQGRRGGDAHWTPEY